MKNKIWFDEDEGNVVLHHGEYTFTYCGVTLQEMVEEFSWRDFNGCSSDQDSGAVTDFTEKDADRLDEAIEKACKEQCNENE